MRSHRETAESVLSDYASLASSEFTRRTLVEVGYYGYHPLITAVRAWNGENPAARPVRPADLPVEKDKAEARELARFLFRFDAGGGTLETSEPGPGAPVIDELRRRLAGAIDGVPTDGSYVTLFAEIDAETHSFVYMPADSGEAPPRRLVGFEVELASLGGWIERAADRGPLLPPSLTEADFSNDSIFLEVKLADGRTLYRRGEPYEPWLGVEKPFGSDYRGLLEEVTVRLAIDPEVAPELVIGGLPRSRLPLLLGVLGVVAGLVLIAILQLGRERALIRLRSDFVSRVSHELRTPLTRPLLQQSVKEAWNHQSSGCHSGLLSLARSRRASGTRKGSPVRRPAASARRA